MCDFQHTESGEQIEVGVSETKGKTAVMLTCLGHAFTWAGDYDQTDGNEM